MDFKIFLNDKKQRNALSPISFLSFTHSMLTKCKARPD